MADIIDVDQSDIVVDHTRMVERVISAMHTEVEPLQLRDLADIAGVSPFYFNRIFKSIVGIPPGEFATSLRFQRAKDLLITTPASVTEVCFETGYESLGTFSSRFKKLVGVSPAEFKRLPEAVASLDLAQNTFRVDPRMQRHRGYVRGTMAFPNDQQASIFVGIYPAALAADRPVVGRLLAEPGPFELPHVPWGTWIVLSAALPRVSDPLKHLLPKQEVLVAASAPFSVAPEQHLASVHLQFRPPSPFEPPVLTALPALLLG